jgi:aspartate aminotransferase
VFERLELIPPDPILGLIDRFRDDPSPDKVDLGVGVYRNEAGETPIMTAVRRAARIEIDTATSKAYFGQAGNPEINPVIQELVLGPDHPSDRAMTLQTPGGSGALRIAAELLVESRSDVRMWVPAPTWANHVPLIGAAGVEQTSYPYYSGTSIDRRAMFDALESAATGDAILIHASCHNPTGADLTDADFRRLADLAESRGLTVLADSAYQGFAEGLDADAAGIRILAGAGVELLVATSFSKNFGLYRDRAGALTVVGTDSRTTRAAHSNALRLVRTMYSVPPDHGPAVVARILGNDALRQEWQQELDHMRRRLFELRALLVSALADLGAERFRFIADQHGMFSLLGVSEEQAGRLIEDHHVYLPRNGRINVAGIDHANVAAVAAAIVSVSGVD